MFQPPKKLLVATTNASKLAEIRQMLAGLPVELLSLADIAPVPAPEEEGTSFAENARAKAVYYAEATGLRTVAEDSGLEIDALGGAPGVHSARFGGVHTPYPERFPQLYAALRATGSRDWSARFVCALALVEADQVIFEVQETIEGTIAPAPAGQGGFGYDPIFFYPPFGCTLAEAGQRKSDVSHRAKAFRLLKRFLARRVP